MTSVGFPHAPTGLHWGMLARLNHIRLLRYAGLFTWAMLGLPLLLLSLEALEAGEEAAAPLSLPGWGAWLLFGLCYAWLTRSLGSRRVTLFDHGVLVLLTLCAVGVGVFNESGLGSILLVVSACLLPWLLPMTVGVVWLVASQLLMLPVFVKWLDFDWLEALVLSLLYAGFSGFVFVTSLVARQQGQAREEQRRLNTELRATRALLAESVRVNERTRISRELHDLLGHHLTALSLNLEVAHHLVDGKAQDHVAQARTLARLLLSDVREAVSRIRDSDTIDMALILRPLADNVPGLHVEMELPDPFVLDDAERAHVLLRCTQEIVTNVVRHAQAEVLRLAYRWERGGVLMTAIDDGRGADAIAAGNGLRGMRERLRDYDGSLSWQTAPGAGFRIDIHLPLGAAPTPAQDARAA